MPTECSTPIRRPIERSSPPPLVRACKATATRLVRPVPLNLTERIESAAGPLRNETAVHPQ